MGQRHQQQGQGAAARPARDLAAQGQERGDQARRAGDRFARRSQVPHRADHLADHRQCHRKGDHRALPPAGFDLQRRGKGPLCRFRARLGRSARRGGGGAVVAVQGLAGPRGSASGHPRRDGHQGRCDRHGRQADQCRADGQRGQERGCGRCRNAQAERPARPAQDALPGQAGQEAGSPCLRQDRPGARWRGQGPE